MVNNDTYSTCTMLFSFTLFNTFKLSVSIRKNLSEAVSLHGSYIYACILSYTHIALSMS